VFQKSSRRGNPDQFKGNHDDATCHPILWTVRIGGRARRRLPTHHGRSAPSEHADRDAPSDRHRGERRRRGALGGYPSTTVFVDRLFGESGAYAYLRSFRNELRFAVTDLPIGADAPIQEILREDDLHVTSIAVDHDDVPAVAFRIEHAGHAVVVSGDLASKNDNLARLAASADLLVYDTAVVDPPGSPKKLYDLHTAPHRIGEIAATAKVRSLLLSHIPPAVERSRHEVLGSVRGTFSGATRFAEDCMRIDLTK
jgi:hypothetical protein